MMTTRAYQISDRPGATVCIGQPDGRERPVLWIEGPSIMAMGAQRRIILASFHGDAEAMATANYLDALVAQIQRVIDHLAKGDQ